MLGIPIEIWIVCVVTALVKVKYSASTKTSCSGNITDYAITLVASVVMGAFVHQWAILYFGFSEAAAIPMAVLVTLSAESVMTKIMEFVSNLSLAQMIEIFSKKKT